MKFSLQTKALIVAIASGLAAVGMAFGVGELIRTTDSRALTATTRLALPPAGSRERQGYDLFMMNCAHCHGRDARGDEGPDLHGVTKSDERLAVIIKNGIKGEMPKFGAKLTDNDVHALVAFVRSLKDMKS